MQINNVLSDYEKADQSGFTENPHTKNTSNYAKETFSDKNFANKVINREIEESLTTVDTMKTEFDLSGKMYNAKSQKNRLV